MKIATRFSANVNQLMNPGCDGEFGGIVLIFTRGLARKHPRSRRGWRQRMMPIAVGYCGIAGEPS